jgi:hypothetical protein
MLPRTRKCPGSEGHLIEGVKELTTKLEPQLLPNHNILHERNIRTVGRRSASDVAPNRAVDTAWYEGRRNKGGGVEKLLNGGIAGWMVADDIVILRAVD